MAITQNSSKRKKKFLTLLALFIILAITLFVIFKNPIKIHFNRKKLQKLNIMLITLDTLRADHLSCYNKEFVETPHLDIVAAEGVLFERCYAQAPLTLPAHTTILSGTYPLFHKVRDNGGFVVPEKLKLISEVLKENNFTTSAFIGAYVLHSKWGLKQGFDEYDDTFDLSKYKTVSLSNVQRRADAVLKEAQNWLEKNREEKFFTWIHLYDPHTPYEPPEPFSEKYARYPYRGEVAFMDSELGKFFDFLKKAKIWDNTLIIITGDHGEMLGEHEEPTHGYYIYESAVRVPLIIKAPFSFQETRISEIVQHTDLVPTVLDALNLSIPDQVQGESLLNLMFGKRKSRFNTAYTETYYTRLHFGWSELRAFYHKNWKYILAPEPELYDLSLDTRETENLHLKKSADSHRLRKKISTFIQEKSQNALSPLDNLKIDSKTMAKLATLGYVSSTVDISGKTNLIDPKQKIKVYNDFLLTKRLSKNKNNIDQTIEIINRILKDDPHIIDAHMSIGNLYFRKRDFKNALKSFYEVIKRKPDYNFAMHNIIRSLKNLKEFDKAKEEISRFLKTFPEDPTLCFEMGDIYFLQNKYDEALVYLNNTIKIDPYHARALNRIGEIYISKKNHARAEEYINRSRQINPNLRKSYFNMALIEESKNNLVKAAEYYRKELEINPKNFRASYNLAEIFRKRGENDRAIEFYYKTIDINNKFNIPYFMIAKLQFESLREIENAIKLCERGVKLKPANKYTAFGYFILADIFSYLKNHRKSELYLSKGQEVMKKYKTE